MALVNVTCKKCGQSTKLDVGSMSKDEVVKALSNDKNGFQCFGNHVEFGSRADFWIIDWTSIHEGSAPSEEEFIKSLKDKYDMVLTTDEIREQFEVKGFTAGLCVAVNKNSNEEIVFDFMQSPRGKRYYFA